MEISIENYLSKFRVFNPTSLFPPDFENLRKNLCPVCSRKLYWSKDLQKAFCKSKIKDRFFISRATMSRLGFV